MRGKSFFRMGIKLAGADVTLNRGVELGSVELAHIGEFRRRRQCGLVPLPATSFIASITSPVAV